MTDGESPIIPDLGKIIKTTVDKTKPEKTEGERRDKNWADLGRSPMWTGLLKPYLEDRVASLKAMIEVNLTGGESVAEVGTRFLICNAIAGELQFLVDRVEQTKQVLDKKVTDEKKRAEQELDKKLAGRRRVKKKEWVSL